MAPRVKMTLPQGHSFIYRENLKNIIGAHTFIYWENLKNLLHNCKAYSFDTFLEALVSSNHCPLGQIGPTPGAHFYRKIYREKLKKNFFFRTKRPIPLMFCLRHYLVNLYQFYSNRDPGVQIGPALDVNRSNL